MITGNEPINPVVAAGEQSAIVSEGITLRQYYAGLAMQGLLSNPTAFNIIVCATDAVRVADALITELNKSSSND